MTVMNAGSTLVLRNHLTDTGNTITSYAPSRSVLPIGYTVITPTYQSNTHVAQITRGNVC